MVHAFESVRVPKAAELVASALRMQIITGVLAADDSLPSESVLMEQFGVSRPTLREAFRILESESLITVRRGAHGGARVTPPNGSIAARHVGYALQHRGTTMRDIYQARTVLEVPVGGIVANSAETESLDRLDAALAGAVSHIDKPSYITHDVDFHLLVAELSGNKTLSTMVEVLYNVVIEARRRYAETLPSEEITLEQREVHRTHEYFVQLIRRGDREAAAKLWEKHLVEIEGHYSERPMAETVVEMMG